MEYRYVTCPGCQAKLKYQGERTLIGCLRCKKKFSVATQQTSPNLPAPVLPASSPQVLPKRIEPLSSNRYVMLVAVAIGIAGIAVALASFVLRDQGPEMPIVAASAPAKQIVDKQPEKKIVDKVVPVVDLNRKPQQADPPPASEQAVQSEAAVDPKPTKQVTSPKRIRKDDAPVRSYRWTTGDVHTYEFELTAGEKKQEEKYQGRITYTVGKPIDQLSEEDLAFEGTGFVVSENGYLVTCEHVVRNAKTITVTLGQQQFAAEVIAKDAIQDLALLRIQSEGLTPLPISAADDVQLAQSVRVVGYPLASVLGRGVKVSGGTVTGACEESDGGARQFQIDAAVNPGNSGGPVVDQRGSVIGVASQLFSGRGVNEVGFAAPAAQVRALMKQAGLRPIEPKPIDALTGPELAQAVTPSVAFLQIQVDPTSHQSFKIEHQLQFRRTKTHPGSMYNAFQPIQESGWFTVSRFGEISGYQAKANLPYAFDPVGLLAIEDLGQDAGQQWSSTSLKSLIVRIPGRSTGIPRGFPRGFPEPFFRSHFPQHQEERKTYTAIERIEYQETSQTPKLLKFTKSNQLRTLDNNDLPCIRIEGQGTVVFDKKLGVTRSLWYESTLRVREEDGSLSTFPFTLRCAMLNPARIARERLRAKAQDTIRKVVKTVKQNVPNPKRVKALIAILNAKSNSIHEQIDALAELAEMAVATEHQDQVSQILVRYAAHDNPILQLRAMKGLDRWATAKSVPKLLKLLEKENDLLGWHKRQKVMEILGRFGSPRVYQAIAARLKTFPEQITAKEILIRCGADAELAVSKMLDSKSQDAREAAAEILLKIGTRKSLRALEKAEREEPEFFLRRDIQKAIQAIRSR